MVWGPLARKALTAQWLRKPAKRPHYKSPHLKHALFEGTSGLKLCLSGVEGGGEEIYFLGGYGGKGPNQG